MNSRYFSINRAGCSIRCKFYGSDPDSMGQVVLCTHGFSGNKENKAAERLAHKILSKRKDAGILTFDWPCHGEDARKKLTLADCDQYLTLVTDYARSNLGAQTILAYSSSFGAYLTLKYITEHHNPFGKIALRSAAVKMYEVLENRILTEKEKHALEKGKDVLVGFNRKIKISRPFMDSLKEADITKRPYGDFSDRILLIHGTKDEIVPPASVQGFARENHIPFIAVEKADHRFTDSRKTEVAINEIIRFFWPGESDCIFRQTMVNS